MNNSRLFRGTTQILTACLIWGYGYVVIKDASVLMSLDNLMSLRYLMASAALCACFFPRLLRTNRRALSGGVCMGLLLYLSQYCQTAALGFEDTSAGSVAFITALYVVLVPFLHAAMRRRLPSAGVMISALLAVAGLFLLVHGSVGLTFGCRLAMLGSALFSVHILVIDVFSSDQDPIILTVWQFLSAALFSCLVQAVHGTPLPEVPRLADIWRPVTYLGIFSTMLGFLMQTEGQKNLSPEFSSLLLSTEAVFGMFFSVLLTQESMTACKAVGCGLMLAAVVSAERQREF